MSLGIWLHPGLQKSLTFSFESGAIWFSPSSWWCQQINQRCWQMWWSAWILESSPLWWRGNLDVMENPLVSVLFLTALHPCLNMADLLFVKWLLRSSAPNVWGIGKDLWWRNTTIDTYILHFSQEGGVYKRYFWASESSETCAPGGSYFVYSVFLGVMLVCPMHSLESLFPDLQQLY